MVAVIPVLVVVSIPVTVMVPIPMIIVIPAIMVTEWSGVILLTTDCLLATLRLHPVVVDTADNGAGILGRAPAFIVVITVAVIPVLVAVSIPVTVVIPIPVTVMIPIPMIIVIPAIMVAEWPGVILLTADCLLATLRLHPVIIDTADNGAVILGRAPAFITLMVWLLYLKYGE
ncbi:hypothetical protein K493DRAFT_360631 [Basidiobolus meristosporus CBS 931.73]|uniref:Uncharacterized protein n=1 Tax=Basidiobolus meristosporus CBS 931.73 TaxID=1314790 RepID=A0A1Y1XH50_9FUNG|nr:hypothetical protein K493DRAFT_360631 [Basidiobolus meristosporus CBS 931.73]|eukprot:ORX84726.1 hypothetical protein K493DRAFT_360631 [Basidiobolus meristosporus CBS 931.73]